MSKKVTITGSFNLTDEVEFQCPFCKQRVLQGNVHGSTPEHLAVLHDEPACQKFKELEALEFLRAVRLRWHQLSLN